MRANLILYLNLWGTCAKLLGPQSPTGPVPEAASPLFAPASLIDCQMHFASSLSTLARRYEVEVQTAGDYAYARSHELRKLVEFAASVFHAMVNPQGRRLLWPLRGAIAEGSALVEDSHDPWLGPGRVKAAEIEKSAVKGMRLFIEKDVLVARPGELEATGFNSRLFAVRGREHYELNWLGREDDLRRDLDAFSTELMELGTNYSQQLSASLRDLIRWARSEQRDQMDRA